MTFPTADRDDPPLGTQAVPGAVSEANEYS